MMDKVEETQTNRKVNGKQGFNHNYRDNECKSKGNPTYYNNYLNKEKLNK